MPETREWLAESLRLTVFTSEVKKIEGTALWTSVVGEGPETAISRPGYGVEEIRGSLGSNRLVFTMSLSRLDWHLTPAPQTQRPEAPSSLGDFNGALKEFIPVMSRFLELSPS